MRRRILAVIVLTCVMSLGLAGCGKNDNQETGNNAGGGMEQVEAKGIVEMVSTDGFRLTVREGYTGRAYTETKDLVVGDEPGGVGQVDGGQMDGSRADGVNEDMIVVNYSEGKKIPENASYFKLEKLKRQETDIREIAEGAAKLQDGEKTGRTLEESTIGALWPDIKPDSLAGRAVYHVTTTIRDNDFMFEHFFFQTDAGVNMVVGIFYPIGDETARKDMMDQFYEVEFLK